MNRRLFVVSAASAIGGAGAKWTGCSRRGRAIRRLLVATSPYVMNSGFYVALEKGYFRDAGLEVEIGTAGSSSEAIPLLAGGGLDVALFSLSAPLVNAWAAGARFRIVAARGLCAPGCPTTPAIYWRGAEYPPGVEGIRKLRGKKVAIGQRATIQEFLFDTMIEAVELHSRDFELVYLPLAQGLAAMVSRRVDAILSTGFVDSDLTKAIPGLIAGLRFSDFLPDYQIAFVLFGERLLDGDPAVGASFLAAYLKGVHEFQNGATPEFLRKQAEERGLDTSVAESVCRNVVSADGAVRIEDLERFVTWTVSRGYCRSAPDVAELVGTRFLNLVNEGRRPS